MFDQSYQQLYVQKQVILLNQNYPCPRCKHGQLEPFGETETFSCSACSRQFVALNSGRILYPAGRLKIKIAPIFWWDGMHWHLAGTTATAAQSIFLLAMVIIPTLAINAFVFYINHCPASLNGHTLNQGFILNIALLNVLIAFFMLQLFYLFCWEHNRTGNLGHSKRLRH